MPGSNMGCRCPPSGQQLGKPCRETTAHLSQELVAVGPSLQRKAASQGLECEGCLGGRGNTVTHSAFR